MVNEITRATGRAARREARGPRRASRGRGRRALMLVAALVAGSVAVGVLPGASPVQADEPVAITEAPPLTWGFKSSWRAYTGPPEVSGGATVVDVPGWIYDLAWDFDSGTFDPATGTTVLQYRGTVHWTKYPLRDFPSFAPPGYTGSMDVPILDVTLTDPVVTISRQRADIVVDAISRQRATMELEEFPASAIVNLGVSTVVPEVTGTTTVWPAMVATVGAGVVGAFDNSYTVGTVVDAVSFSYTGPGGAPDFSDAFDEPGTVKLEQVQNEILTTNGANEHLAMWWYDEANHLTHWRTQDNTTGTTTHYAFSLETMARVGEPWVVPTSDPTRPGAIRFADLGSGRAYHLSGTTARWVRFDTETGTYETGVLAEPFPRVNNSYSWDAVNDRPMSIRRVVPAGVAANDYDNHVWTVATFIETEPGVWTREEHAVPSFPTGLNAAGYATGADTMAALPDGSLVVLGVRQTSSNPAVPAPATYAAAHRIVLNGDGTATAEPIAGTDLPAASSPYERIVPGPGGQMNLIPNAAALLAQQFAWDGAAGAVVAGPVVDLTGISLSLLPEHAAVDPNDGTMWVGDVNGRRLVGINDGRIVANQYFPDRHPRGGFIFVGPDSTVYAQTNDGSDPQFGGSPIYGIGKFERVGVSPTVTGDPEGAAVTLGIGETSEEVSFTSTAVGEPAPTRQWQVRAPGSVRFVDIEGETGETLTVQATGSHGGSEYRAIYTNAAGRVASEPAVLTVLSAPAVLAQPQSETVAPGQGVQFLVMPTGSPYPEITWQRLVDGQWVDLSADDPGYEIEGGFLTVLDAQESDSGSQFRAKLTNTVATIYSDVVTLTVGDGGPGGPGEPGEGEQVIVVDVPELGPGEFVWSIDGSGAVDLGVGSNAGDHWAFDGEIHPIVVTDTRESGPSWSISGQVGDFTGGLDGKYLGWSPKLVSPGGGTATGEAVASGFVTGNGLKDASTLASAPTGHDRGTATVGADLDLRVPIDTAPGTYTTTLTVTALT